MYLNLTEKILKTKYWKEGRRGHETCLTLFNVQFDVFYLVISQKNLQSDMLAVWNSDSIGIY